MRTAMIQVYNEIIKPNNSKIKMIMQVHDEMIFECDKSVANDFAKQIQSVMENIAKLSVPLRAEYVIAPFWGK